LTARAYGSFPLGTFGSRLLGSLLAVFSRVAIGSRLSLGTVVGMVARTFGTTMRGRLGLAMFLAAFGGCFASGRTIAIAFQNIPQAVSGIVNFL
jgi:hypothetical protein